MPRQPRRGPRSLPQGLCERNGTSLANFRAEKQSDFPLSRTLAHSHWLAPGRVVRSRAVACESRSHVHSFNTISSSHPRSVLRVARNPHPIGARRGEGAREPVGGAGRGGRVQSHSFVVQPHEVLRSFALIYTLNDHAQFCPGLSRSAYMPELGSKLLIVSLKF